MAAADSRRSPPQRATGRPLPHDSARLHVSGTATYTDDLPEPRDLLHVAVGMSSKAHARIKGIDFTTASIRSNPNSGYEMVSNRN